MSISSHTTILRTSLNVQGHSLVVDHPSSLSDRAGPVWMFIHGIAVCSAFWAPLMPARFRDESPWISVSLPVHAPSRGPAGFSRRDVTPELFAALNGAVLDRVLPGRDVVIVGHSTGGFAGLCLAVARPDRVRGLVSVGGFADGRWAGLEGDMQRMARKEKLGALGPTALRVAAWLTTRWPWLHARTVSMFARDKRALLTDGPTQTALAAMRRDARRQDHKHLIEFFAGIRDVDIWDQVGQVTQPALVLTGELDPVIPPEKTLRLAKTLPNSRLLLYPGVGHMVMNERREEFWRDIIGWRQNAIAEARS